MSSSQATFFKLVGYNLLPSILTLRFRNCGKFNFGRSYLLSDSHTNTVLITVITFIFTVLISDRFAYSGQNGVENRDKAAYWRVHSPEYI